MFENGLFSLNPVQFFALSCDCFHLPKKEQIPSFTHYALPSTQHLTGEESFAKIAIGWSEEGLGLQIQVDQSATKSFYPLVEQGDSVELFFDTRDIKSAGFNTRFCHHFFFLPQQIGEVTKGEKTHFRTEEDSHPLCDSQMLYYQVKLRKNDYRMDIFIPAECLYGYNPTQFDRLGFTYRLNRYQGDPQHFAVTSQDYQIDQQPSLWGSLRLIK